MGGGGGGGVGGGVEWGVEGGGRSKKKRTRASFQSKPDPVSWHLTSVLTRYQPHSLKNGWGVQVPRPVCKMVMHT